MGSTSGGRVESGCSHCCIYRGHFSTTWPVFLQTKQRQSQEGSEAGSVRGLGTVGVAEVLADGSWWVRLRGGWDGGRSEFPVVVSPLAVGEVEESESLRDRLPSRESVFMGSSSMVEWDFPVNRLDSDNEATTTPYVSNVTKSESTIQTTHPSSDLKRSSRTEKSRRRLGYHAHSGKNGTSSEEGILPPDRPPPIVARSYSSQPLLTRP